jgi:uncharacterized membrane protein (GlpM family)
MKKMDIRLLLLYFFVGGLVVAASVYYGSRGQGLLAAFISLFPGATVITFLAIYYQSGIPSVVSIARGTLILLPPWILYIAGIMLLPPRIGMIPALLVSVAVYIALAILIMKLT